MPDVRFETFGLNGRLLAPPKPMGRIHHHHEMELNLLFRGGVTYLHRGTVRRLEPGRLTAFWGSTLHGLVAVEPLSEMAWITVPLGWLWSWALPERFIRGLMEGHWWVAPSGYAARFPVCEWVRELAGASPAQQRRLLFELQGCLLWMAEHAASASASAKSVSTLIGAGSLRRVETMARCMAERFHEDLTVPEIARAAGLHPNYAMPLFRRHCGVTIRDYLQQYRLTNAQRLLLMTDDKVVDIAFTSGFGSLSAFYEIFQRQMKVTPQVFRHRMRA